MWGKYFLYLSLFFVISLTIGCGESIEDRLTNCEKNNQILTNENINLNAQLAQKNDKIKKLKSILKKRGITIHSKDNNDKSLFDSVYD